MRTLRITAVLAALLTMGPAMAGARSTFVPETLNRQFRLDWHVVRDARGPLIEGFVYNSGLAAERMRLSIDLLDAAGNVVGNTTTWVMGGVPGNGRAWFTTRVPEAASYRVEILSFDWIPRGEQ
ncbi:MAG TPA: hypothetical protein VFL90_05005 [Methylomirabilota bacterium]|nr:hypothetical protein [Methylomirabilota bacterium]